MGTYLLFLGANYIKSRSEIGAKPFDLIASFIVNDNHRFVTSKISGNSYQRDDVINYLLNSSVAFKANNVQVSSLPLGVSGMRQK